jgi:hypothetical protein
MGTQQGPVVGRPSISRLKPSELRRTFGVENATRRLLLYFVMPVWACAGLADWWRHRRTSIETTAGTHEAVLHAVQMGEAGVPALLGLFLEVNAGVLAAAYGAFGLHQATAWWDVKYAESRREVTANEQHIHGMLENVPLMAAAFLTALHWNQAQALVGRGGERPRFRPERKRRPLSAIERGGVLAGVALFVAAPYAEEIWRCARVAPSLRLQPETAPPPTDAVRPTERSA